MPEKDVETPAKSLKRAALKAPDGLGRAKEGHFLTLRDRLRLEKGPNYRHETLLHIRGPRVTKERRNQASAYARARRKALAQAKGALDDLAFLSRVMGPEWLLEVVTHRVSRADSETLPLVAGIVRPGALPAFLELVGRQVGLLRWPTSARKEKAKQGPYVVVHLLAALERGLNAQEDGFQEHSIAYHVRPPTPAVVLPIEPIPPGGRRRKSRSLKPASRKGSV